MRKFILAFFVSLSCLNVVAQNFTISESTALDSMSALINNPNSHDTTLARTYVELTEILYEYNLDTVVFLCEKSKLIIEKALKNNPSTAVKKSLLNSLGSAQNNIGFVYRVRGDYEKALELLHESKSTLLELGDSLALGEYYTNVGSIYEYQGDIIRALDCYFNYLTISEKIDDKEGIATSLNNIAIVYSNQEELTKALEYYDRSLKIKEKINDRHGIATTLNNIATVYRDLEDYDKALECLFKSLEMEGEMGSPNIIAQSLNNIGTIYKIQGEFEKAIEYYNRCLKMDEQRGSKPDIASSMGSLGSAYFKLGDIETSRYYANNMLVQSQEIGIPELIRDAAKLLSSIGAKDGNYKDALEMYELYIVMRDSIKNEETKKSTFRQQTKYEFEKKEALIKANLEIAEEKLKTKSIAFTGVSILGIVILIYSIILYRKKQVEHQLNKVLVASNEVILVQKQELQKDLDGKVKEEESFYFLQSAVQVKFEDIILLESSNNYVLIYLEGRKNPLLERIKMIDLVDRFPLSIFVKIHRSFYVNVNHIVSRPSKYMVKMSNDMTVNATRNYVDNLGDKFL